MCLCICTCHKKTNCCQKTKEILGLFLTPDFSHSVWLHHLHFCVKILNAHNPASTFSFYLPPVLIIFMVDAPGVSETLCICGVAGGLLVLNTRRCHLVRARGLVHPHTLGYALICHQSAELLQSFGQSHHLDYATFFVNWVLTAPFLRGVPWSWTTMGCRAWGETRFRFVSKAVLTIMSHLQYFFLLWPRLFSLHFRHLQYRWVPCYHTLLEQKRNYSMLSAVQLALRINAN